MEITPTMLGTTAKAKKLQQQLDDFVDTIRRNKPSQSGPVNIYLHTSDVKWMLKQINAYRESHGQDKMNSLALCTWRGCFLRGYSG